MRKWCTYDSSRTLCVIPSSPVFHTEDGEQEKNLEVLKLPRSPQNDPGVAPAVSSQMLNALGVSLLPAR